MGIKKNYDGFTLVELLGVIIILSIIMMIALPNITSVLEKNNRESYIADAKKMITQAKYAIRNGELEKPSENEILKISLSYLGTGDVEKDPDGNIYDVNNSYVVIVRKNGYLEYYANLVANIDSGNKGIRIEHEDKLQDNDKLSLVQQNFNIPTDTEIKSIVEVNATIKSY